MSYIKARNQQPSFSFDSGHVQARGTEENDVIDVKMAENRDSDMAIISNEDQPKRRTGASMRQRKARAQIKGTEHDDNINIRKADDGNGLVVTVSNKYGRDTFEVQDVSRLKLLTGAGNDVVKVEEGVDLERFKVDLGAGDDKIENWADGTKIHGRGGKDLIENYGRRAVMHGGAGFDVFHNYEEGKEAQMFGGTGRDQFHNDGAEAYMKGGRGSDHYLNYNDGDRARIHGDKSDFAGDEAELHNEYPEMMPKDERQKAQIEGAKVLPVNSILRKLGLYSPEGSSGPRVVELTSPNLEESASPSLEEQIVQLQKQLQAADAPSKEDVTVILGRIQQLVDEHRKDMLEDQALEVYESNIDNPNFEATLKAVADLLLNRG